MLFLLQFLLLLLLLVCIFFFCLCLFFVCLVCLVCCLYLFHVCLHSFSRFVCVVWFVCIVLFIRLFDCTFVRLFSLFAFVCIYLFVIFFVIGLPLSLSPIAQIYSPLYPRANPLSLPPPFSHTKLWLLVCGCTFCVVVLCCSFVMWFYVAILCCGFGWLLGFAFVLFVLRFAFDLSVFIALLFVLDFVYSNGPRS